MCRAGSAGPAAGTLRGRLPSVRSERRGAGDFAGGERVSPSDASVFRDGTLMPLRGGGRAQKPSSRRRRPEGSGRASGGSRRGAPAIVIVDEAQAAPGAGRSRAEEWQGERGRGGQRCRPRLEAASPDARRRDHPGDREGQGRR